MNYLAHIFLARQSDAAMVGAMLGDFVKANGADNYPSEIAREITLHRNIDSYTDNHPAVRSAIQLFGEGRRRYAGIVLDVFYDHVLSQQWANYSDLSRPAFIERFYGALNAHEAILPDRLREILPKLVQQDWLGGYHEISGVEFAIERVSTRLSKNGHLLRECIGDLRDNSEAIAQGFEQFFPELIEFARERRAALTADAPPDITS